MCNNQSMITKKRDVIRPIKQTLFNLKRMLTLAWTMDRTIMLGYYLTTIIAAVAAIVVSIILKFLVDDLIVSQNLGIAKSIPTIVIIVLGARYLMGLISEITVFGLNQVYFDYLFRYKLQNYINYSFYQKLTNLDIAQLEDPDTQNLIAKAKDTMTWRPPDFLRSFSYFLSSVVTLIAAFIVLLPFGWWIPVSITLLNIPFLYLRAKFGSIQWSLYGSGAPEVKKLWYFTWLLSTETAIKEMRIFKSTAVLLEKFKEVQKYLFDLNSGPIKSYLKILLVPSFFEAVVMFSLAYFKLGDVTRGILSVGSFTLLVNMIDTLNGNVGGAVINFGEIYTHSLYVDHYFQVMELPKLVKEIENPITFKKLAPPRIEFKNVSFAYPNGSLVLKNISFVINPGENIAFVGDNGAGKSTIIKLICRFYDVTDGEVLVNRVNIKKIKLSQWYGFLGTLFQDFVQYHFTVKDNISLGSSRKQNIIKIREAAKKAGALEFIEKLPQGFDTMLGREFEEGKELSIGQWQKLAIARAFYEEAPLLILDEPTSAIDAESEYEIFNNLSKTYKNKSLILVSHRFSTVRNADMVFVVQDGQITENGTHEDLLKLNGKYARMFTVQAKGYS
jgi:ATP-binding cassette subfamily B protein